MCPKDINQNLVEIELKSLKELENLVGTSRLHYLIKESHVIQLDIQGTNVLSLPESIGNFTKIEQLWIRKNGIEELPRSINNMNALLKLDISNNQIKDLPNIGNLTNLKILNLANNQIQDLPNSFKKLKELEELHIHNNKLNSFPKFIDNFKNLRVLNLKSNRIREIPGNIGNLNNLENLNVGYNAINKIPHSIGNLKNLTSFFSRSNNISEIPESIGSLKKLEYLDLRNNEITRIPHSLCFVNSLKEIELNDNKIRKLPYDFQNLSQLKKMTIDNNYLETIPKWSKEFDHIKKQIMNSFNFPLIFTRALHANPLPLNNQKKIMAKLHNPSLFKYFWLYIINRDIIGDYWTISLYVMEPKNSKTPIKISGDIDSHYIKHIDRRDNFLKIQISLNWPSARLDPFLLLVDFVEISAESDRGDLMTMKFSNFYYTNGEFLSNTFLKFDSNYSLEPFAKIIFKDINIVFEESLNPIIKKEYLESNQIKEEDMAQINSKFETFQSLYTEPIISDLIVKIGKNPGSWFGKYAEYLAAGVILTSTIPSILQFFYRFILSFSIFRENWFETDLSSIQVPVLYEIITYLPLIFFFIFLTYKFIKKQRFKKKIPNKSKKKFPVLYDIITYIPLIFFFISLTYKFIIFLPYKFIKKTMIQKKKKL